MVLTCQSPEEFLQEQNRSVRRITKDTIYQQCSNNSADFWSEAATNVPDRALEKFVQQIEDNGGENMSRHTLLRRRKGELSNDIQREAWNRWLIGDTAFAIEPFSTRNELQLQILKEFTRGRLARCKEESSPFKSINLPLVEFAVHRHVSSRSVEMMVHAEWQEWLSFQMKSYSSTYKSFRPHDDGWESELLPLVAAHEVIAADWLQSSPVMLPLLGHNIEGCELLKQSIADLNHGHFWPTVEAAREKVTNYITRLNDVQERSRLNDQMERYKSVMNQVKEILEKFVVVGNDRDQVAKCLGLRGEYSLIVWLEKLGLEDISLLESHPNITQVTHHSAVLSSVVDELLRTAIIIELRNECKEVA